MIFHASIPADEPERVARVLAELWGGEALPFPPWPDAFVAMAGDARNSSIEVYPRARTMRPGPGPQDMVEPGNEVSPGRYACFHLAVASALSPDEVIAIGAREGWRALRLSRAGVFEVVELWVENALMIEVLTEAMQRDYLERMTLPGWKAFLEAGPPA